MKNRYSLSVVIAGFIVTLGVGTSWGAPQPPNPTPSDANGNTAGGLGALASTGVNGYLNTAFGYEALTRNIIGSNNTATGYNALRLNITGYSNTATGIFALQSNKSGSYNTATGWGALGGNNGGYSNTATGWGALSSNNNGNTNTAIGIDALSSNITGNANTASGAQALQKNTNGHLNVAIGLSALLRNTNGSNNIAVGTTGGSNLTNGSNNIAIGNPGVAEEANTIRLGSGQTRTFIAGINGVTVGSSSMVLINASGQLGTTVSSARYKRDIQDMGAQSRGLLKLRPVTFRYKQDPQGAPQYGLTAEEVAKVYPELVTRGTDGEVESVQYHELIPMLLNELQRQQQQLGVQSQEIAELRVQNTSLRAMLGHMQAREEEQQEQRAAVATRLERLEKVAGHQGLSRNNSAD
jgi:hypothetical protein